MMKKLVTLLLVATLSLQGLKSFDVTVTAENSETSFITGDINSDGDISIADLVAMEKYIHGKEDFKIVKRGNPPKK